MRNPELSEKLARQHYYTVGDHGAVKICHWPKKSKRGEGVCYKQQFYGIQSHRCLQMTPCLDYCTQNCVFCWRNMTHSLPPADEKFDDPVELIDGCEEGQRKLLSGFGGIPETIDKKKFEEAQKPNNAAISLSGEPSIYPHLDGMLHEFEKRGYTTYLVSNGTQPKRISQLDTLPTQLYLSLDAPSKKTYEKIDLPLISDGWERINETIDLMPSLDTKKVFRLTMVDGLNIRDAGDYAKLIGRGQPDFVEVKAFMFVGGSRYRLTLENMPSHESIRAFSKQISEESGYSISDEKEDSRVVLLKK